jgi:hypothetical protein
MYVAVMTKLLSGNDEIFKISALLQEFAATATLVLQSLFGSLYMLKPV